MALNIDTTPVIVYPESNQFLITSWTYFNTTLVIVYQSPEAFLSVGLHFNTTLVIVYETRNHGFMRSVRHCRQIYDKLPASYRVLQLLYPMLLRHARLPAGPIHYISSMSVILITVLSGSLFFSTISKQ